jgi:hypothetical protein
MRIDLPKLQLVEIFCYTDAGGQRHHGKSEVSVVDLTLEVARDDVIKCS